MACNLPDSLNPLRPAPVEAMARTLAAAAVDLENETACILALKGGCFAGRDVATGLDAAIVRACELREGKRLGTPWSPLLVTAATALLAIAAALPPGPALAAASPGLRAGAERVP